MSMWGGDKWKNIQLQNILNEKKKGDVEKRDDIVMWICEVVESGQERGGRPKQIWWKILGKI